MHNQNRLIPFFELGLICLLLSPAVAATPAQEPPRYWPPVFYARNEDSFHQEQFQDLYVRTALSIRSAAKRVFRSPIIARTLHVDVHYPFRFRILIVIKDVPEETLYRGLGGTAGWRQINKEWFHELTINLGSFMQNPDKDLNSLLAHEMAHIALADVVGRQAGATIPSWLNEGMAQSVTEEGRNQVQILTTNLGGAPSMVVSCDLGAPVDTFAHGEGNGQCYPEYFLAVQRLEQHGGSGAIQHVLRDLRNGQPISSSLESAIGMDMSQFQADVDAYTADVIAGRKPIPHWGEMPR